jgi:hypothetical protein
MFSLCLLTMIGFSTEQISAETLYGPQNLKNRTFDSLTIMGPASLKNIKTKSIHVTGPLNAHKLETQTLNVQGPASLKNCHVFSKTLIQGPLKATSSTFKTLEVKGPINFDKCTVSTSTVVFGPVIADESQFQDITAHNAIIISHSTAKSIHLKSSSHARKDDKIELLKGSTVQGNIVLENIKPKIHIDKTSKHNGKVIEEKIIKVKKT